MAYDEGLAQRVREILHHRPDLTERKMFGGIGFMLSGNMFCGVGGDGLMLRVGPEAYEETLTLPNVSTFGPKNRPMTGWVLVEPAGIAEDSDLAAWIARGLDVVAKLPPK